MSSPAKHAHHLAVEIGPRPPTSEAEARAAQYAVSVFEQAGLSPTVDSFEGLRSFGRTYIPVGAGLLAGALLATRKRGGRWLGTFVGGSALAAALGEASARFPMVTRAAARGGSQNVLAVLPASGERKARLVLVAHLDSSRSGLMFHPRLAKDVGRSSRIELGLAAATVGSAILPLKLRRAIGFVSSAVFAYALGLLIERELHGIDVAGANDNASGAGILLGLAETLAADPLHNTEVWFVATGCEESGLIGMQAFLDQHSSELRDAWFVGIDTVAGPGATVRWITHSGLVEPLEADRQMIGIAKAVADEHPEFEAEPGLWRNMISDHDAALVRGYPAMMIAALTPQGTLPNWHWPTDTYDNLDENVLDRSYSFVLEFAKRFDAESANR